MRAGWTACGACTSGSTAPPMGATSKASGGATTTNTKGAEPTVVAQPGPRTLRIMVCDRTSPWAFSGILALIFVASAAATIAWSISMSAIGGMPMPGGWTMSMTWMMMPGQTWLGAIASFLGMWLVMMVAMMLPSLAPMLSRYR